MDRDDDGVPDWQQDERYADEAPLRGPWRARARRAAGMPGGCALPVAFLLAGAGLLARLAAPRRHG
jgi:hypothetical protein